jgi:hypothetical protein
MSPTLLINDFLIRGDIASQHQLKEALCASITK